MLQSGLYYKKLFKTQNPWVIMACVRYMKCTLEIPYQYLNRWAHLAQFVLDSDSSAGCILLWLTSSIFAAVLKLLK